jgi:hypothetical protein
MPRIKLVFSSASSSSDTDDDLEDGQSASSAALLRRIRRASSASSPSSSSEARFAEIDNETSSSHGADGVGSTHSEKENDGKNRSLIRTIYGRGVVPVDEVKSPEESSSSSSAAKSTSWEEPREDEEERTTAATDRAEAEIVVSPSLDLPDVESREADRGNVADDEGEGGARPQRTKYVQRHDAEEQIADRARRPKKRHKEFYIVCRGLLCVPFGLGYADSS